MTNREKQLLVDLRAWMKDHPCEGKDGTCLCKRNRLYERIEAVLRRHSTPLEVAPEASSAPDPDYGF